MVIAKSKQYARQERKRLGKLDPDKPLCQAARPMIDSMLGTVWHYLPLAAEQPGDDVEHVHQLRVATRRAGAALSLFREVMPDAPLTKVRKDLKRIRRAAGEARNLDVLIPELASKTGLISEATLAHLLNDAVIRRADAQRPIRKVARRLTKSEFPERVDQLVEQIDWYGNGPQPSFADAARIAMRPIVDEFFAAADADLTDIENLHALRICGKHVRYALELLGGSFDDDFRAATIPVVKQLQERLGRVNDHCDALLRFQRWLALCDHEPGRSDFARLVEIATGGIENGRDDFFNWWGDGRGDQLRKLLEEATGE